MLILKIIYSVFSILLGVCAASFLNVLIYRIPRKISFVHGRSKCPSCGETIKPYDLIPILSRVILRGKCRNCKAAISVRYSIFEAIGGLLFLLCFLRFGFTFRTVTADLFCCVLLVLAGIDIDTHEIPDILHIIIVALAVFDAVTMSPDIISRLIGAVCVSIPFLIIALLTGGLGGGDIKLMAATGLLLGWRLNVLAAALGFIIGALISVILLARKSAKGKTEIAFGPYLASGLVISMLYGDYFINGYLSLFGF